VPCLARVGRTRQLGNKSATVDDRRRRASPHPRPSHGPAGQQSVGNRLCRGCLLRRCEHRQHRGDRPRGRSPRLARRPTAAGTAGPGRRRRRGRRRLAHGGRRVNTVAAAGPSVYWYLTRGSGVVALVLLTVSIVLGIVSTIRWSASGLPRFAIAGLHRTLTLLAIVFVAVHVVTTVVDGFAPDRLEGRGRPISLAVPAGVAGARRGCIRSPSGTRDHEPAPRADRLSRVARYALACRMCRGRSHSCTRLDPAATRVGWLAPGARGRIRDRWSRLLSPCGSHTAMQTSAAASPPAPLRSPFVVGVGIWYRNGPGASGWAARAAPRGR